MNYEEVVERLKADGYIKEKNDERTVPQTFFREAIAYMEQKYHNQRKYHHGWSAAWDHIRKLVMWTYGVSTTRQIPFDKQQEANDLAMKLIDTIY